MKIGVVFPQTEIGPDVGAVRAYGQCADQLGYHHVLAFGHVLGADPAIHRGWKGPYDVRTQLDEPFVRFGFLAGNTSLHFTTGVLILPQRETVLVAKQGAELDLASGGRLRLGVGVGWNPVEYVALGQDFAVRGRPPGRAGRPPCSALDSVVGHLPGPLRPGRRSRPVAPADPAADPTVARWRVRSGLPADGPARRWRVPDHGPWAEPAAAAAAVADSATAAGRDPAALGMEGRLSWHGDPDDLAEQAMRWRGAGATHVWLNTMNAALATPDEHLAALASAAEVLFGS